MNTIKIMIIVCLVKIILVEDPFQLESNFVYCENDTSLMALFDFNSNCQDQYLERDIDFKIKNDLVPKKIVVIKRKNEKQNEQRVAYCNSYLQRVEVSPTAINPVTYRHFLEKLHSSVIANSKTIDTKQCTFHDKWNGNKFTTIKLDCDENICRSFNKPKEAPTAFATYVSESVLNCFCEMIDLDKFVSYLEKRKKYNCISPIDCVTTYPISKSNYKQNKRECSCMSFSSTPVWYEYYPTEEDLVEVFEPLAVLVDTKVKDGRFYDDQDLPLFQLQEPDGNKEILIDIYKPRPFDIKNETNLPYIYYNKEMHFNPKSPLYPTIISFDTKIKASTQATTLSSTKITPNGNYYL
jgi:hypothetical protein